MNVKPIIITSSGLKNINLNRFTKEDEINLIFGSKEIKMKRIFAEFISPLISRLYQSDPTIELINFSDLFPGKAEEFNNFTKDIITEDLITILMQISYGFSAEKTEVQALKLRFLSIILGNEELFIKINELFPPDFSTENLDTYVEYLQSCFYFSHISIDFDFSSLIDFISKNFYLVNPNTFLKLSHSIQYSIISNPHLQIKTEDWLLDLICQITGSQTFSEENDHGEKIDNISFLEQIEFTGLIEPKLREFLSDFDFNLITNSLWRKLYQCFFIHFNRNLERYENVHFNEEKFEYIENETDRFEGIFDFLTKKFNGNVDEKNICKITASSILDHFVPSNVANFSNSRLVFSSQPAKNSWLEFDFIGRRVNPTHYSIKTTSIKRNDVHLKNWVIEGSNDNEDWIILDSRTNDSSLNNPSAERTFKISQLSERFYKYIRIRQTGLNWKGSNQLIMDKFEIFGTIK